VEPISGPLSPRERARVRENRVTAARFSWGLRQSLHVGVAKQREVQFLFHERNSTIITRDLLRRRGFDVWRQSRLSAKTVGTFGSVKALVCRAAD